MAFVDGYTAWVMGHTAEANREGIQAIVDEAPNWEKRSGQRSRVKIPHWCISQGA